MAACAHLSPSSRYGRKSTAPEIEYSQQQYSVPAQYLKPFPQVGSFGVSSTVRLMLATHPWSTWPLHVKLFTDTAVKNWKSAEDKTTPTLPPGFTLAVELEGVDGKTGQVGSGRCGPLSIDDAQFTSAHLAKNTALLASNRRLTCSICTKVVSNYSTDHLKSTLCPTTGCTAVSHLSCLSEDFLSSQTSDTGMIPRGGHCKSCRSYVLWGDIVRGMYRRAAGGALAEEEEGDDDALFLSDIEADADDVLPPKSAKARGKAKAAEPSPKRGRPPVLPRAEQESSEGEAFDFNVSSSTDSELPSPRKRSRPRKNSPAAADTPAPSPRKRAKPCDAATSDVDMADPPPAKRGPKSKSTAVAAPKPFKRGAAKPSPKKYHTLAPVNLADSSDFFESDSLGELGAKIVAMERRPSNLGAPRKLILRPGEVDFFDNTQEDAISRAMSVLSVAAEDVIILSD